LDELIKYVSSLDGNQSNDLVLLSSITASRLSETAWQWLVSLAFDELFAKKFIAFEVLSRSEPKRFGQLLKERNWTWDCDTDCDSDGRQWMGHYGSLALISATVNVPFDQIVGAIAPWLIPYAVFIRARAEDEAPKAAELLSVAFFDSSYDPVDPGADITINEKRRDQDPLSFSVSARPENLDNPVDQFRIVFDSKRRRERLDLAYKTAVERIKKARKDGAKLYLSSVKPLHLASITPHVPTMVAEWLEGAADRTPVFKRRLLLAEGFYLALCEALFESAPDQGACLWRALRVCLRTRYIGAAGIETLIHILFRAPNVPEALREEALDACKTNTDSGLLDVVIAAQLHGQESWVESVIATDVQSCKPWRLRRAEVMRGFLATKNDEEPNEWPVGQPKNAATARSREAAKWVRSASFARHWWKQFCDAQDDQSAYAAWVLLLKCVDRRAYIWMTSKVLEGPTTDITQHRRLAHFLLNLDELKDAMKKREKDLSREFLGHKIVDDIAPWLPLSVGSSV
jgi:hypothetical protein